jgi:hypothetical protein
MTGLHIVDGNAQERDKYAEIWSFEEYQTADSPGLQNVSRFMDIMKPAPGETLIDIGCGSGKAGLEFQKLGLDVGWTDITDVALDEDVPRDFFYKNPLWGSWARGWSYGFCCDVLEHIPTEYTMLCLDRIITNCSKTWFQIALRDDVFGKLIGEPLHLTVRSFDWWLVRLQTLGNVVDARDLCGDGLYIVERR